MEEKTQLAKFTFYDLYAELMDTLTDEERGKLLRAMCAYAFENAPRMAHKLLPSDKVCAIIEKIVKHKITEAEK